ncbi:MAG: N-acetyl-alpha-D-glucosaminyl L-malate synthase BshA [Saprospiraceae bacterium]|nr:N-acetyl-alpha-D-glucosaminyl L-malate synthase BshA [Saprospiraceae bacterium]
MKIGIVCYPTFGGSGVMATELGIGLAKKGHQIHFISYKRPARLTSYYKDIFFHEVGSIEYPLFEFPPYDSTLASKIVDVTEHEKLDVLHVHYAIPHAAVAFMAREILKSKGIDLPVITTLHGTDITLVGLDKSMSSVVEFSINQSDVVTSVSNSLKAQTESYFNVNKNIDVVYNFIDTERFKRKENEELRNAFAPNGEKIIAHTSNFRKVKRIEDVIHAYSKVREKLHSKLLLIGDGPERINAEELCRELGTCNDIQFLGKQDAVEDILSIADLFMLPSQNESFGLAALEALSCGVPVISSNAGGLPEVNINGKTGFTCKIGDVEDMANKALLILESEQMLADFRKNARNKALEFKKSVIIPQYEEVYMKALQKNKVGVV